MFFMKKSYLLLFTIIILSQGFQAHAQKTINVSKIDDFIKAIAPNKVIKLKSDKFILSNINRNITNSYVNIRPIGNGLQLEIKGVSNLRIEGASTRKSKIISNNQFAGVLLFDNCDNITIDNVEIGHAPTTSLTGEGAALEFKNSKKITLNNSLFFGNNAQGLVLRNCSESRFENITIQGCTKGILSIHNSNQVEFSNCRFTNNQQYDLINVFDTEKVSFNNCLIDFNKSGDGAAHNVYALFNAPLTPGMYDPIITLTKCTIEDNHCQYFCRSGSAVKLEDCQLDNNIFERGYNSHK